jgi:hypothetical protein
MAVVKKKKGVIAILTGGGDVPGLNPAIRANHSSFAGRVPGNWFETRLGRCNGVDPG